MFNDDDLKRNGTPKDPTSWAWKHNFKAKRVTRPDPGRLQRRMNPHTWYDGYVQSQRECKECERLKNKS